MSIADLIRRLAEAGAPPEAIAIAVDAVETAQQADAERRAKQAARKRALRSAQADVPGQSRDSLGTVQGQSVDSPGTPSPSLDGSPTPPPINPTLTLFPPEKTSSRSKSAPLRPLSRDSIEASLIAEGVPERILDDWKAVRRQKRAGPITETVAAGLRNEARKAGFSLADAVRTAAERGWQGFRADLIDPPRKPPVIDPDGRSVAQAARPGNASGQAMLAAILGDSR